MLETKDNSESDDDVLADDGDLKELLKTARTGRI
jgi:hypothetical protein